MAKDPIRNPTAARIHQRRHASLPPAPLLLLCFISGCAGDELSNRVAIEVAVQIGGQRVGDGSLALRPAPGVQCPLIKIPVVNGVGHLPRSSGPVPGVYRATFRPGEVQANLTQQLSETGRVAPRAARAVSTTAQQPGANPVLMPKGDMEITVPDKDPAFVAVSFDAA